MHAPRRPPLPRSAPARPSRDAPPPDLRALAARLPARPRTRFAPSPTGWLHLGHVVNALYTWGVAGALGGTVLLRIEDHDRERSRPEYERGILEDLAWLGLEATRAGIRGVRTRGTPERARGRPTRRRCGRWSVVVSCTRATVPASDIERFALDAGRRVEVSRAPAAIAWTGLRPRRRAARAARAWRRTLRGCPAWARTPRIRRRRRATC